MDHFFLYSKNEYATLSSSFKYVMISEWKINIMLIPEKLQHQKNFFQHIHKHKVSFYLTSKRLISMQPKTRHTSRFHRILEPPPHEIQVEQIFSFFHLVEIDHFSCYKENLRFLSDHLLYIIYFNNCLLFQGLVFKNI